MSKVSPKISSFTLIVAFLCVAIAGIAFIPLLPVKLSPSRTLPKLVVSFQMPGNSARVIEMEVTSKLEAMLARIKGIKSISSTSGNGWGSIQLDLDKHTDVDVARFEASTIVRQSWSQLPAGLSYPVLQVSRPDDKEARAFMSYTLNAAATPVFIQRYAEEQIKPRLSSIKGIYRIDVKGATPMEWRLTYNNDQLISLGITVNKLQEAIRQYYNQEFLGTANVQLSKGEKEWIRLALVSEAPENGFDPSKISVSTPDGEVISLAKLIRVTRQEEMPQSYYRINGLNSIYLSIVADESANQLQLAKQVKDEIARMEAVLPAGYEIHTSYDATEYIQTELDKIYVRSGLTVLILLLFVLLIMRNLRYLLLIVVSLTVNILIAVILYYLLGLEMQLYSLAGVTISLSLIIDNTIVMADHIRTHQNRLAFLSVLAATLTTIGSLAIIFFLNEEIRLNLQDFAAVIIVNLFVSLAIALFFVPALMDKMGLNKRKVRRNVRFAFIQKWKLKGSLLFRKYYGAQIRFMCRWRVVVCLLLILAFGLPVFLLPEKIEPKDDLPLKGWQNTYNEVVTSSFYKESVKPIVEKVLGGTLRLFVDKVYEGSYFTRSEETVLSVSASMPNGTTLAQMNNLMQRMEAYLSTFTEIKQFQTNVYSARQAGISIYFTKESEQSGFPYTLKSKIISKALELGGGSWGVWGLQDQGFSNDVRENAGSYRIEMLGYNYDELYNYAEALKDTLLTYRRIKEVLINARFSWWKDDYKEFYFNLNKARMAEENIMPMQLFQIMRPVFTKDEFTGSVLVDGSKENLKLSSTQSASYDVWALQHNALEASDRSYKMSDLAAVEKGQMPQEVAKVDQQYRLCLQYEYIGASNQGNKIQERVLKAFNKTLPMGYSAKSDNQMWTWGEKDKKQYLLLALIIVIIFFTTSVLFNSLRLPLAVIFVIPISYIGVFLTFYLFKLNFDQGGFASFVLLCGITVNASIYILNEFDSIRKDSPAMPPVKAYLRAWNLKIIPIFLTVVSTILGFIPFLVGTGKEGFWFPLAAGTIGGLVMSIAGIFFYLPVFTLSRKKL